MGQLGRLLSRCTGYLDSSGLDVQCKQGRPWSDCTYMQSDLSLLSSQLLQDTVSADKA